MIDYRFNKKVLLIAPPYRRLLGEKFSQFPFGLCSLASVIQNAGWGIAVYNMESFLFNDTSKDFLRCFSSFPQFDLLKKNINEGNLGLWRELTRVIKRLKPDIVGITALTNKIPVSLKIAEIIKKINPNVKIILGGVHATVMHLSLIKNKNIDFIVRREGERTIVKLLDYLENDDESLEALSKIDGVTFKFNGKYYENKDRQLIENLDELPYPATDLFVFPKRYKDDIFSGEGGMIMTSRGCPFSCKFCSSRLLWSNKVRFKSVEKVIEEIKFIIEECGTNKILFLDDNFCIDKERAKRICEAIIENDLKITMGCQARLDSIDEEIIDMMKKAGCNVFYVGVESGSDRSLAYINKRLTTEQITDKIELINRKGISITANCIIGFPEESAEDIEKTIKFAKSLSKFNCVKGIFFVFFVPYPGCEFYYDCIKKGVLPEGDADWIKFLPINGNLDYAVKLTDEEKKHYIEIVEKFNIEQLRKHPGL